MNPICESSKVCRNFKRISFENCFLRLGRYSRNGINKYGYNFAMKLDYSTSYNAKFRSTNQNRKNDSGSLRQFYSYLRSIENNDLTLENNPSAINTIQNDVILVQNDELESPATMKMKLAEGFIENRSLDSKVKKNSEVNDRSPHQILLLKTFASQFGSLTLPPFPKVLLYSKRSRINSTSKIKSKVGSRTLIKLTSHNPSNYINKRENCKLKQNSKKRRIDKYEILLLRAYVIGSKLALLGRVESTLNLYDKINDVFELRQAQKGLFSRIVLLSHICSQKQSDLSEAWKLFVLCFGTETRDTKELYNQIQLINNSSTQFNINWMQRLQLEERIPITGRVVDALLLLNFETSQQEVKFKNIYEWCAKYDKRPSYYIIRYIGNIDQQLFASQLKTIGVFIILSIIYIIYKFNLFTPSTTHIDLDAIKVDHYARKAAKEFEKNENSQV